MHYAYMKLDLNMAPPRATDLDLLNAAGQEGWELVLISSNAIAYLVREIAEEAPAPARRVADAPPARRRAAAPDAKSRTDQGV